MSFSVSRPLLPNRRKTFCSLSDKVSNMDSSRTSIVGSGVWTVKREHPPTGGATWTPAFAGVTGSGGATNGMGGCALALGQGVEQSDGQRRRVSHEAGLNEVEGILGSVYAGVVFR